MNERYKLLLQRNSEEGKAKGKKPQSGTKLVEDFNKYVDELLKLTPHNKAYPVLFIYQHRKLNLLLLKKVNKAPIKRFL